MNPAGICFFNPISGGRTVLTSVAEYPDGALGIRINVIQKDESECSGPIDLTPYEAAWVANRLRFLGNMIKAYELEKHQ